MKTLSLTKPQGPIGASSNSLYRLNVPSILRRSLYAGVFVRLAACQPENTSTTDASVTPAARAIAELPPLLTLDELLNADDFQVGIKQAVLAEDNAALQYWQEQLIAVANEVRLSPRDLNRISGAQGLMFIEFEAKKQLFHDEFVKRFMNFEAIDDLLAQYPYLTGVHQRALSLIQQRDLAVQRAAALLLEGGLQGDAVKEARAQWQDYMLNSGNLDLLSN